MKMASLELKLNRDKPKIEKAMKFKKSEISASIRCYKSVHEFFDLGAIEPCHTVKI